MKNVIRGGFYKYGVFFYWKRVSTNNERVDSVFGFRMGYGLSGKTLRKSFVIEVGLPQKNLVEGAEPLGFTIELNFSQNIFKKGIKNEK